MHIPVMLDEVLARLVKNPGGTYLDGTLGGGGHSEGILKKLGPGGKLYALDVDEEAIREAESRLSGYENKIEIIRMNYAASPDYFSENYFDGILLDLGVSSMQFDSATRGFSFRFDSKLDMRMDNSGAVSAREIINGYSREELTRIFSEYGEIPKAGKLAFSIIEEREKKQIETTGQLVKIAEAFLPRCGHLAPATKIFQALRIEVNNELGNLRSVLSGITGNLKPGGRIAVLAYHSLEDRIVKNIFRENKEKGRLDIITKKPLVPERAEILRNPRARSAKLRVAEKRI